MAPETSITYYRDEEALTIIGHLMDSHNKHGHTLNDISFKLQELEETVTESTSLSGGAGIEITNDNIINLDFSEFSTDNITEGSTNLFHSDEKVDDRVNNLLQEGSNIVHTYDDIANTFTISTSMDPTFDTVDSPIIFTAVADVNIIRGQVVYISGTHGNGTTPTVNLALASNTTKMPAFGMARDNVSMGDTLKIVTFGSLYGIRLPNTITFALGDTLYVSSTTAGEYTNVSPGGESNQIQNIGKVQRIGSGSSSVIKVGGAGRTNATSNLNSGKIFYGNSSDRAVPATLSGGNNVTITYSSVLETLTISALGTAVSGNENEVHVINSSGDGFKVSNPLVYMDSTTNAVIVGYDSANPMQSGSDLKCRQVIADQNVRCVELYSGSGGAQSGYRSKIGNDIHLGAGIYESTWNGDGTISAFYYDIYNGTRQSKPEIKIARLSNVTKGQAGHHTFQIGPHSTNGAVKFIVDLYNNASNSRGEMTRVAIGREPFADTELTVGSFHVLKTSTTGHQVIIGGSPTNAIYFTFSETGKLGLGNTQDYGSSGQVLTSGGTGAPTWESVNSLLLDESQHVSGSITYSDTVVNIYNTWESDTQYKGAILTLSDNSYDSATQVYTKTVRAAIKGGTSSTGTDTSGYLAMHTSDGTGNEAREVARFTSEGKFGLGTDSPTASLHIFGEDSRKNIRLDNYISSGNIGGDQTSVLLFNSSRGTEAVPSAVQDGDLLGYIDFTAHDGTSLDNAFRLRVDADGNWTQNSGSSRVRLQQGNNGSLVNSIVLKSGKVGIGEIDPGLKLHVNSGSTNECARFESLDTEVTIELKDTTGTASLKCRNDFRFNTSTNTEVVRITTDGKVGIGEDIPDSILHITSSASGGPQVKMGNGTDYSFINFDGTSLQLSTQRDMVNGNWSNTAKSWGGITIKGPSTGSSILFYTSSTNNTNASQRMILDENGFVGIGTTGTISNHLHVNSGSTNIAAQFESTDATGGIKLKDSTGNVELTTKENGFRIHPNGGPAVFTVNGVGALGLSGSYGSAGEFLKSNGSGTPVSWDTPIDTTYSAGTGVTLTGTTFSIGQDVAQTATPTFYDVTCSNNLNVNGIFSFDRRDSNVSRLRANTSTQTGIAGMNPNIYMGNIDTNDSNGGETANRMGFDFTFRDNHGNNSLHTLFRAYSTSYNGNGHFQVFGAAYLHNNYTSSDDRYKHGETNITNGLEIVRKLVPQTYKKTRSMLDVDNDGTDIGVEGEDWFWESGLIAQEVEQIDELSRYVTSLDDKKQLSYNNIHTYTLAGVKELDTIVQQQAQLIKSLEARIQALENN